MVDAVGDASRKLGSSLDKDSNNEDRGNRQTADQCLRGEYAMLDKNTTQVSSPRVYLRVIQFILTKSDFFIYLYSLFSGCLTIDCRDCQ